MRHWPCSPAFPSFSVPRPQDYQTRADPPVSCRLINLSTPEALVPLTANKEGLVEPAPTVNLSTTEIAERVADRSPRDIELQA